MARDNEAHLTFPLQGAVGAAVRLPISRLKTMNMQQVLGLLQAEVVPLKYWRRLALEYYRLGMKNEFLYILKEGTSTDEEDFMEAYRNDIGEVIVMMAIEAAYFDQQSLATSDSVESDAAYQQGTTRLETAAKVWEENRMTQNKKVRAGLSEHHPSWSIAMGNHMLTAYKREKNQTKETKKKPSMENLKKAETYFKQALDDSQEHVAAHVGLALVSFYKGDFENSLKAYRRLLVKLQERGTTALAHIRFNIALCLFKLNKRERAIEALEAVVSKAQPAETSIKVDALCSLSDLKRSARNDDVESSLPMLQKALELDNTHPLVFCQLANHHFHIGDQAGAQTLLEGVTQNAQKSMKGVAEARFQLGRLKHTQGDLNTAESLYSDCVSALPQHAGALYGLAQVTYGLGDADGALTLLERAKKVHPDNYDIRKFMAHLLMLQPKRHRAALEIIEKILAMNNEDADVHLMKGMLLQQAKEKKSDTLTNALRHLELYISKTKDNVAPEVYNNMACLCMSVHKWVEADDFFAKAAEALRELPKNNIENKAMGLTIEFNRARLLERKPDPDLEKAQFMYNKILKECPGYSDAKIALGVIHYHKGEYDKAINVFQGIQDAPDAVLMNAIAHYQKDDLQPSIDILIEHEKKLKDEGKNDVFTCVLLGNLFHEKATMSSRERRKARDEGNQEERSRLGNAESKYLDQALKYYVKALELDKTLWMAIRGVGVIVAHRGQTDIAQALLNKVKKYVDIHQAKTAIHLDLGHLSMDRALDKGSTIQPKASFQSAVSFYRVAHRQEPNNAEIAMYYASALFHSAVSHNDVSLFKNCQMVLNQAMILDPNNIRTRFNAATCLMRCAYFYLRDQQKMQIEEHVNTAVGMLRAAHRMFEYLKKAAETRKHDVNQYIPTKMADEKKLVGNAEYCKKAVLQCENFLKKLAQTRQQRDAKNEATKKEQEREAQRIRAEKARLEEEELERKRQLDEMAEQEMQNAINWKLQEQADAKDQEAEQEKRDRMERKKRAQEQPYGDDEDYVNEDQEEDFGGATLEELGLASSDEDEPAPKATGSGLQDADDDFITRQSPGGRSRSGSPAKKRLRKQGGGEGEQDVLDEDFDMEGGNEGGGSPGGQRKRQRTVESDDE